MDSSLPVPTTSQKANPTIEIITYDGPVPRKNLADVTYELGDEPGSEGANTSQSQWEPLLFVARTDIMAQMENKLNEAGAHSHNQGPESKGLIHDDFDHSSVMAEQQIVPGQENHEHLVVTVGCRYIKGRYSTMRFGRELRAMTWPGTWNIILAHEDSSENLQHRERVKTAYRISGG
jgi:hypothetical protein